MQKEIDIDKWLNQHTLNEGVRRLCWSNFGLSLDGFCCLDEDQEGNCKAIYQIKHCDEDDQNKAKEIERCVEKTLFDAVARYAKTLKKRYERSWEVLQSYGLDVPDEWYLKQVIGECACFESDAHFRAVIDNETVRVLVTDEDDYYCFAVDNCDALCNAQVMKFIGTRDQYEALVDQFYQLKEDDIRAEIIATKNMLAYLKKDFF